MCWFSHSPSPPDTWPVLRAAGRCTGITVHCEPDEDFNPTTGLPPHHCRCRAGGQEFTAIFIAHRCQYRKSPALETAAILQPVSLTALLCDGTARKIFRTGLSPSGPVLTDEGCTRWWKWLRLWRSPQPPDKFWYRDRQELKGGKKESL